MRLESEGWSLHGASIMGQNHLHAMKNCQDALSYNTSNGYLYGVVCDGCGEGQFSEIGARLISNRIITSLNDELGIPIEIRQRIGHGVSPQSLLKDIWRETEEYINKQIKSLVHYGCYYDPEYGMVYRDDENIVKTLSAIHAKDYWLATIVGFVFHPEVGGCFFYCGDGILHYETADKTFHSVIEQNNKPNYLTYCCIDLSMQDNGTQEDKRQKEFSIIDIPKDITRLFVATDGYATFNPLKTDAPVIDPWNKKGHTGLKRWINTMYATGCFTDDASLIVLERTQHDKTPINKEKMS